MSRRPYWCPKTMKRWPCWCPKPILWELNSFLMQTLSFIPKNLHRCWPREWKNSTPVNPLWKYVPPFRFYLNEWLWLGISSHFFINDTRGAFLWDDPDQNQWSKIAQIMLHQMNWWIHSGQGFFSSFDLPQSDLSDLGSLILIWIIPKECTLRFKELKKTRKYWAYSPTVFLFIWSHNETLCSYLFGF